MKPDSEFAVEKMFDVYCRTIMKNRALNYHKSLSRVQANELPLNTWQEPSVESDFRPKYSLRCERERLILRDETLYAAVKTLPRMQRRIVILYYGGEMSDANIAIEVKLPKSTVNYKRNRAIETLRELLRLEGYYV